VQSWKRGEAEFAGMLVHLGALGVVVQVTLACVDDYRVHETIELLDFEQWAASAASLVRNTRHVKFWLELYTGKVVVYRGVPTQDAPRGSPPRWLADARVYLLTLLQALGARLPGGRNAVMWLVMKNWPVLDRVAHHEEVFNIPHAVPRFVSFGCGVCVCFFFLLLTRNIFGERHFELEYAFPATKVVEVMTRLRSMLTKEELWPGHITEIRFVKRGLSNFCFRSSLPRSIDAF
jgi:hypothetical protein